jgi:hypothetical protein
MRQVSLVTALVCSLALTAAAARGASLSQSTTIVGTIQDVVFGGPTAACSADTLFEVDFSLVSPRGDVLGSGTSCVHGWAGTPCPDVPQPGCHQTTLATFVFNLAGGSISAPMALSETAVAGGGEVQQGRGEIAGGTGAYAGATGIIADNGIISFTAGIQLSFVVHIG